MRMVPFALRPLDVHDDIVELTDLIHRAYAGLGARGLNYTAVDQTVETTIERCSAGECWVAVGCEDELIGTVTMSYPDLYDSCILYRDLSIAIVNQLAVEPSYHGQGVGKALVEAVAQHAAATGYRALALDTAEDASELVEWYRRLGFETAGVHQWEGKRYRSLLMTRILG